MSRGRHARDGQRRDAWRAAARDTWTLIRLIPLIPMIVRRARTRAADSPAPAEAPVQAPRPADPPPIVADLGVVRAGATPRSPGAAADGTGTSAGTATPAPAAAATAPGGAANLPRPVPAPPGAGPGQPLPWVITQPPPGSPLGYQPVPRYRGDYRPTQPFRAIGPVPVSVVRPYYPAAEARRDSTARWGA